MNVVNTLSFLGSSGTKICQIDNLLCVEHSDFEMMVDEFKGIQKCNCLPSCKSIKYETEIATTDFKVGDLAAAYSEKTPDEM